MARRSGAVLRTKKYERFRGVDFSTDPALVDDTRSPWAPNMIADRGGMPEKRPGWRTLETFGARINGIFHASFGGAQRQLVHAEETVSRSRRSHLKKVAVRENLIATARRNPQKPLRFVSRHIASQSILPFGLLSFSG